jgi:hypothetical protein
VPPRNGVQPRRAGAVTDKGNEAEVNAQLAQTESLIGRWVRGQVIGWKQSRLGHNGGPTLEDVPLHVYGNLSRRSTPTGTVFCVGEHDVVEGTIVPFDEGEGFPKAGYSFVPEKVDRRYPFRESLRELQSWYREYVLALPPGDHVHKGSPRKVVSRLPEEAVAIDPTLNFLVDADIEKKAKERLLQKSWAGIVNRHRLYHDLLSSQPLCFNLFGFLAVKTPKDPSPGDRYALLDVLNDAFGVEADAVEDVRLEWALKKNGKSKSGSAFDCFIKYRRGPNTGFVGIEAKYSEDLRVQRPTPAEKNPEYGRLTENPGSGFKPGASDVLNQPTTCQLWYNACLALRVRDDESYDEFRLVMTSHENDESAKQAVAAVRDQLVDPEQLRWVSYQDIVSTCRRYEQLNRWADHFNQRYLDLSPVSTS